MNKQINKFPTNGRCNIQPDPVKTLVKLAIFRQRISSAYLPSFPQAHSKKVQLF